MNIAWKLVISAVVIAVPCTILAGEAFFCPQNHAYIKVGMSEKEVLAACGEPLSQQDSNQPVVQKIKVQQLYFNSKGAEQPLIGYGYQVQSGFNGVQLQVNMVDQKVKEIIINGTPDNAASFCPGAAIQIGDPLGKVYGSCGEPAMVNETFINQAIPSNNKPKIWIYQPSPYQPGFTLTFVDGKLQSIN
jgi:hypothetical protein